MRFTRVFTLPPTRPASRVPPPVLCPVYDGPSLYAREAHASMPTHIHARLFTSDRAIMPLREPRALGACAKWGRGNRVKLREGERQRRVFRLLHRLSFF